MVKAKTPARQAVRSAALYARISADADGKSLGVQRQLEDCRRLAADRGWPVGAEYVDNDVSAFSGKPRQQYARMLVDLESGARDAVIVYNLDRLHRRPVELEEFVTLCERTGVSQVATVCGSGLVSCQGQSRTRSKQSSSLDNSPAQTPEALLSPRKIVVIEGLSRPG